jgi:hypothetical protein
MRGIQDLIEKAAEIRGRVQIGQRGHGGAEYTMEISDRRNESVSTGARISNPPARSSRLPELRKLAVDLVPGHGPRVLAPVVEIDDVRHRLLDQLEAGDQEQVGAVQHPEIRRVVDDLGECFGRLPPHLPRLAEECQRAIEPPRELRPVDAASAELPEGLVERDIGPPRRDQRLEQEDVGGGLVA